MTEPDAESPPPSLPGRPGLAALGVFCAVFLVYSVCPIKTQFDSMWTVPTAMSLIREGNTNLDEYGETAQAHPHGVSFGDGHWYSDFPLGPSLLVVPVVLASDAFVDLAEPLRSVSPGFDHQAKRWKAGMFATGKIDLSFFDTLEMLLASALMAAAAAVLFLLAWPSLGTRWALLAALVFAFATPAWSTASRALWQHGPSMLMLSLALWILHLAREREGLAQLASLPLAAAYVMRPTNAVSVAVLSAYVLLRHRRYFIAYLVWGLAIALPFVWYSEVVFGSVLPPYFRAGRLGNPHFLEALAGNLVSPARGLFVFSPVLLLAGAGLALKAHRRELGALDLALVGVLVLHWLAISSFPHWWAGHSYGPRFFSDMTPYLVYFLLPVFAALRQGRLLPRLALGAVFTVLFAASAAIHLRGATSWAVYGWNDGPPNVEDAPARLWDWADPQFLRR
ncbi:MAG: hypothetical protein ACYC8T_32155 [Myxococcaceae bacterium]